MHIAKNLFSRFPSVRSREGRLLIRDLLIALATVVLGILVARLIVGGKWQLAAVLIFSLPALFILQRYPFLAVVVWLVMMPFLMHTTSSTTRQVYWVIHRILPLLTLVVILLPSALGLNRRPLPKLGFPEWMMAAYVAVSVVSILLTNTDITATLYLFYDRAVAPIFLYLVVRLSSPDERMIHWLVPVMFFIALSQSVIGVLTWYFPRSMPVHWVDFDNHRTIGTLVNTNAYITTLVLSGFLAFHFGRQSSSQRIRSIATFTLLLSLYCIFISFSRAAWLAGILAMLGLATVYRRFMTRLVLIILPIFAFVAVFFLQDQLQWASQRLDSQESENSAFSRVPVYAAGVRMFAAKPVTGWGYGNFDRYDRRFQLPPVGNIAGDNKDHASHNFFLTVLAEQGVLGIVTFLAPLVYWLATTFRRFSQLPRHGFWGRGILVIFWMTLLSHFIVYNFANMRVVFTLGSWWLTLGLIARFMDSQMPARIMEPVRTQVFARGPVRSAKTEAGLKP